MWDDMVATHWVSMKGQEEVFRVRAASQRGWGHLFLSCPTVCILRKGSVTVKSLGRERFYSVAAGWGGGGASLGGGGNRSHCCLGKVRAT